MTDEVTAQNGGEAPVTEAAAAAAPEAAPAAAPEGASEAPVVAAAEPDLVAKISDLELANAALIEERDALQGWLIELEKQLADAAAAPKAVKAASPSKARKLQPLKLAKDAQPLTPGELLEVIGLESSVELAFGDGKAEIAGLGPFTISGAAWSVTPAGLVLTQALTLAGPAPGQPPYEVRGYGLFVDGDLVAYRPRFEPMTIPAGLTVNLTNDVIF